MARIRNINPRFFEDETMSRLPFGARLLFIGLWTRCNLNGVFEWNAKLLAAGLFPYDDSVSAEQVEKWMGALVAEGRVVSFEASGKRWGIVPHFSDHQVIGKAERDYEAKAKVRFPVPPQPESKPVAETGTMTDPITVTETVMEMGTVTVPQTTGHRTQDIGRSERAREARRDTPPQGLFEQDQEAFRRGFVRVDPDAPPPPVKRTLQDLRALYPVHVPRDERGDWDALVRTWTWEACEEGCKALSGAGRIYLSALTEWLRKHYVIEEESDGRS